MEILQVASRSPLWEYGSQAVTYIIAAMATVRAIVEFLKANNDRLTIKENANTDRVKYLADAEVEKIKERSIGAEAVVKIWQELDAFRKDAERLKSCQVEGGVNYQLLKQVIESLQKDMDNVMKAFFEKFKK